MAICVRFAPSPTGRVHIGNIRVAMYNWLFARHAGGQFRLRIEDTDTQRCTPESIRALLDAMAWMELDFDGDAVYQSRRRQRHLEVAEEWVRSGLAYRTDKGGTGRGECVVFRAPVTGTIRFDDIIKGTLSKQAEDLADFVIVRSDGAPVFHLANVVDDFDMGVTHVMRGDDHVENTFRHLAMFRALGGAVPQFAHFPMIVNAQGKPYSKRDGAAFVGEFRDQGFLPGALFNYLALLGWSPGEDLEVMTRAEMVQRFSLDRVQRAAAQFDLRKLLWMNGMYMRELPRQDFESCFRRQLERAGHACGEVAAPLWEGMLTQLQPRIRLASEIPDAAAYFLREDYPFDPKAVRKRLRKPGTDILLTALAAAFDRIEEWDAERTEAVMRDYCEGHQLSFSDAVHPVRVAVSGVAGGPGLFDLLVLLGRETVAARLRDVARRLRAAEFDAPCSGGADSSGGSVHDGA